MTPRRRTIPFICGALAAAFSIVAGAPAPVAADDSGLAMTALVVLGLGGAITFAVRRRRTA